LRDAPAVTRALAPLDFSLLIRLIITRAREIPQTALADRTRAIRLSSSSSASSSSTFPAEEVTERIGGEFN
jgi:hypothetical protein